MQRPRIRVNCRAAVDHLLKRRAQSPGIVYVNDQRLRFPGHESRDRRHGNKTWK